MRPLLRELVVLEDRVHRTLRLARATADALFGIDVELNLLAEFRAKALLALLVANLANLLERRGTVNAVHRTDIHACGVAHTLARLGNHIDHGSTCTVGGTVRAAPGLPHA